MQSLSCVFIIDRLTVAVQVLSDPVQRMVYDEIHGYSLTSVNPFLDDSSPKDCVFVDEFSCIGMSTVLLTLIITEIPLTS